MLYPAGADFEILEGHCNNLHITVIWKVVAMELQKLFLPSFLKLYIFTAHLINLIYVLLIDANY